MPRAVAVGVLFEHALQLQHLAPVARHHVADQLARPALGLVDQKGQALCLCLCLCLCLGHAKALLQSRADAHRSDSIHKPANFNLNRLGLARRCGCIASSLPLRVGPCCGDLPLQHR
ncbi:hypothetical protein [Roseateles sp.]|uniref:hypothetical protein n=1 Tax=Roseateles sp. TaxID=1971397 RepID=UPI0025F6C0F4|nr:hypothetical protein [Roseateles sp.]